MMTINNPFEKNRLFRLSPEAATKNENMARQYVVIEAKNPAELQEKVNGYLALGYRTVGGPQVSGKTLIQAVQK